MGSPEAVRIADLLHEIDENVRLIECIAMPDGPWYSVRIEIPGQVAKPLVLPKSMVRKAGSDPRALRTLRNVLRVEVLMQRSRNAVDQARETLARAEPAPTCPRCSKSILPGESVRFEHGEETETAVLGMARLPSPALVTCERREAWSPSTRSPASWEGAMPQWEVRVEVHGPTHREVLWFGEAQDRDQALGRALRYAEEQLGNLDPKVRVTLTVSTA